MKILVTGAAGMLGSHLVECLAESGHSVLGIKRSATDLLNLSDTLKAFDKARPDAVVHTAGLVGGIAKNQREQSRFLLENAQIGFHVIQASMSAGVSNLINFSSSCVYPKDFRQPLVESDLLCGNLESTNEGYALAKIAIQKYCEYVSNEFQVAYRTFIPSNLYGPRDNFDLESGHLLASAIRKVREAKQCQNSRVEVWGTGTPRREFTYVRDLAEWTSEVIQSIAHLPQNLNVGFGRDYSIDDFYNMVGSVLDYKFEIIHNTSLPDGMKCKLMDSSLAQSFGWRPRVDMRDGIARTIDWMDSHGL